MPDKGAGLLCISVAGFELTTTGGWIRLRPILGLRRDRVSKLRVTQQLAHKPNRHFCEGTTCLASGLGGGPGGGNQPTAVRLVGQTGILFAPSKG